MPNLTTEMCCLEDINENLSGYGNHNQAYTVRYRQLQTQNCYVHINGLTVSTEILNLHLWSDDSSYETEN